MHSMLGALQTNAMLRASTGNIIMDTLMGTLLAALVGYLFSGGFSMLDVAKRVRMWFRPRAATLLFTGRLYYSVSLQSDLSDRFVAVTDWVIAELMRGQFLDAAALKEIQIPRHLRRSLLLAGSSKLFDGTADDDDGARTLFNNGILILDQNSDIRHREHPVTLTVHCTVTQTDGPGDDGTSLGLHQSGRRRSSKEYCECNVTVASEEWDIVRLNQFVNDSILAVFRKRALAAQRDRLSFYIFTSRDSDTGILHFDKYPWRSTKQYQHVISEEMTRVRERVQHFVEHRAEYEASGRPYALTFLLHGPPGCGKTSLIKAVANATKRNVVDISLPRVKNRQTLMDLFHDNGRTKPSETIFVMDEIDRMGKVVQQRPADAGGAEQDRDRPLVEDGRRGGEGREGMGEQLNALLLGLGAQAVSSAASSAMPPKEEPLMLCDILNVMDGLLELSGSITFITANHPERLDKALMRPGRIDMRVYMGPASEKCLREMLHMSFPSERERLDACDFSRLDKKVTPAMIEGMCVNNELDTVLQRLEAFPTESTEQCAQQNKITRGTQVGLGSCASL